MKAAIKIVAFDAFGTLLHIAKPTHPYRWLLEQVGDVRVSEVRRLAMTQDIGLEEFGRSLRCSTALIERAQQLLSRELSTVTLFEDVIPTLMFLRANGLATAVVSNLAAPYGARVRKLLQGLVDVWCLSYEIGAMKPDRAIFDALLQRTNCSSSEVLMIGDRWESDVLGAGRAGIRALLLDRSGARSNSERHLNALTDLEAVIL